MLIGDEAGSSKSSSSSEWSLFLDRMGDELRKWEDCGDEENMKL